MDRPGSSCRSARIMPWNRRHRAVRRCTFGLVAEVVTERRWRTFADVVAFTLGTNVWISIVILPAIFVGALKTSSQISAATLPFVVLLLGLARRSEGIL